MSYLIIHIPQEYTKLVDDKTFRETVYNSNLSPKDNYINPLWTLNDFFEPVTLVYMVSYTCNKYNVNVLLMNKILCIKWFNDFKSIYFSRSELTILVLNYKHFMNILGIMKIHEFIFILFYEYTEHTFLN